VAAQEGRILFMTTNHVELLDPALIRPGRVDVVHFFGLSSSYQIQKMFERFYPNVEQSSTSAFVDNAPANTFSMAELQGHLLRFKGDPTGALQNLQTFLQYLKPHKPRKTSVPERSQNNSIPQQ